MKNFTLLLLLIMLNATLLNAGTIFGNIYGFEDPTDFEVVLLYNTPPNTPDIEPIDFALISEDNSFRLIDLNIGTYYVAISNYEDVPQFYTNQPNGEATPIEIDSINTDIYIEIYLEEPEGGAIGGIVETSSGSYNNITVEIFADYPHYAEINPICDTTVDPDTGAYNFLNLDYGTYYVVASIYGLEFPVDPNLVQIVEITEEEPYIDSINFVLDDNMNPYSGEISGTLTRLDTQLQDSEIRINLFDSDMNLLFDTISTNSSFSFEDLAFGTYIVSAISQDMIIYYNQTTDIQNAEIIELTEDNSSFINADFNWQSMVSTNINENVYHKNISINNYPNPFNPTTTISYKLPENSDVKLDIFNVRGQKVKTLVNGKQDRGMHQIKWNGLNSNNKQVESGMYFYKLSAGSIVVTKKMTLLK